MENDTGDVKEGNVGEVRPKTGLVRWTEVLVVTGSPTISLFVQSVESSKLKVLVNFVIGETRSSERTGGEISGTTVEERRWVGDDDPIESDPGSGRRWEGGEGRLGCISKENDP